MLTNTVEVRIASDGTIVVKYGSDVKTTDWVVSGDGTEEHPYLVVIPNSAGVELPNSGGIGTRLFYIVGGLLTIGAGAVLLTRKRVR